MLWGTCTCPPQEYCSCVIIRPYLILGYNRGLDCFLLYSWHLFCPSRTPIESRRGSQIVLGSETRSPSTDNFIYIFVYFSTLCFFSLILFPTRPIHSTLFTNCHSGTAPGPRFFSPTSSPRIGPREISHGEGGEHA